MLWSVEVPKFYVYEPEGVAELELFDEKDQKRYEALISEINEKCIPSKVTDDEEFPNEVILGPNRKILDDSKGTFKLFDRSLSVTGIPPLPPNF